MRFPGLDRPAQAHTIDLRGKVAEHLHGLLEAFYSRLPVADASGVCNSVLMIGRILWACCARKFLSSRAVIADSYTDASFGVVRPGATSGALH
jgi:hypothetical protein